MHLFYLGGLRLRQGPKSDILRALSSETCLALDGFIFPQLLIECHLVPVADSQTIILTSSAGGSGCAGGSREGDARGGNVGADGGGVTTGGDAAADGGATGSGVGD